jgi:hypothetical protein
MPHTVQIDLCSLVAATDWRAAWGGLEGTCLQTDIWYTGFTDFFERTR